MYFDWVYYGRVLRHVWSLRDWPGRPRMLFRLLLLVPLATLFHSLCFLLDYVLFPSLWRQKVQRPVFIIGHARSGTTLAHRLLAADGDTFSYFLYWELLFPSLLQKKVIRGLGYFDARCLGGAIKQRLREWDDKTFGKFRHIHDMSLWNAEEDQFVMRAAFVTQQWALDVPMMDKIDLFHVDQMSAKKRRRWLHHYRECVKRQLLLNGGDRIHLSKNPLMCGWVSALIETFPDARFVVLMRDPHQCIPSTLRLLEITWKGRGWKPEQYAASLRVMTDISFESFRHPAAVLAAHPNTAQIFVDYRDITTQPRATLQKVYQELSLPMTDEFDHWLKQQEERERGHKTSFEYTIDDYELSPERIEAELPELFDQYGWPRRTQSISDNEQGDKK
ncbi:sulfotransferase [Parahaliea sp. F7430]|uniref:Sulfotransferase n=1 Tax=Sediminihaliea albiluteola TaxID=2758564 RepID=A0A7W2YJT4_9GAMM|nr:sulfotransferase [Sediminihaliea albiluteola]MBA6413422.1 sulfotransferase [Sediminihaliea albiluteola]